MFIRMIIYIVLSIDLALAASVRQFAVPLGESKWTLNNGRLECRLFQQIPEFGEVSFKQASTEQGEFTLTAWQNVRRPVRVDLLAKNPSWKKEAGIYHILKIEGKTQNPFIRLNSEQAELLMNYLESGYETYFEYVDDHEQRNRIFIPVESFREIFGQYMACTGQLLNYQLYQVKKASIYFPVNEAEISNEFYETLNRMADYTVSDPRVTHIKIEGYSDSNGRRGNNYYISEMRAKAVQTYLMSRGVPKEKISMTWFGFKMPIGDNFTEKGRSLNRRVTVEIMR